MANENTDETKRPWYQRPWVIVVSLVVFAPLGLLLMWRYRPWGTRVLWAVTAVVAGFWILVGVAGALGESEQEVAGTADATSTPEATETAEPTNSPEPTGTEEPTDTPGPTDTPEPTKTPEPTGTPGWDEGGVVNKAAVRDALEDADEMMRSLNLGDIRDLQVISGALPGVHVMVTYKAESALGETDLLTVAAQTTYSAMRALFANRNVTLTTVTILADWVDMYGQSEEEQTTWARLSRETVNSRINWDGLEDRVLGDNKLMFCVADERFIHPGIYSRLGDKGCLLLN